jgi:hypothetical protein
VSTTSPTTAGSASGLTWNYYNQLQNTYKATPTSPTTWDASFSIPVTGTAFGVTGTTGCTITTANGGGAVTCTSWFDYDTIVTVTSPISSGSDKWAATNTYTFTQTTGGNTNNVNYAKVVHGLAIDASCEAFGSASGSATITTSSMTCAANDVIIVFVTGASSSSVNSISDSLTTHLTYTSRCNTCDSHTSESIEEWYTTTGSSSVTLTITVTMSASGTYDVYAFGISGANTAAPFDTHSGLPAEGHSGSAGTPSVSASTSNADDMIIGLEGHATSTVETVGTSPSGLALIGNPQTANSQSLAAEFVIVSAAQLGTTVNFGSSTTGAWSMLVDAVEA